MIGPYHNSISTQIAFVVQGTGYSEMVCPHWSSSSWERESEGRREREWESEGSRGQGQGQQKQGPRYTKVRSTLSPGDVFVAPAGHPIATVASSNENLQIVYFDINSWNNERIPLAGTNIAIYTNFLSVFVTVVFVICSIFIEYVTHISMQQVYNNNI